jgi:hypothetical protein
MCARDGNQQSRGVVTARVRADVVWSLHHQRRDLHQSTYPVPLGRSGLIQLPPPPLKRKQLVSGHNYQEKNYLTNHGTTIG